MSLSLEEMIEQAEYFAASLDYKRSASLYEQVALSQGLCVVLGGWMCPCPEHE